MASWYCKLAGKVSGPFALGQLRALASSGRLSSQTEVRQGTAGRWAPLGQVAELTVLVDSAIASEARPASPPAVKPTAAAATGSHRATLRRPAPPPRDRPGARRRKQGPPKRVIIATGVGAGMTALLILLLLILLSRGCSTGEGGSGGRSTAGAGAGSGIGVGDGNGPGTGEGPVENSGSGADTKQAGTPTTDPSPQKKAGSTADGSSAAAGDGPKLTPPPREVVTINPLIPTPPAAPGSPADEFGGGGGGGAGGDSWEGMLRSLRTKGLDIVITFDSTGSMSGEIEAVKQRVRRIGVILFKLVPKARLSICTYRDHADTYVVKGVALTNDLDVIDSFLAKIRAGGGGDGPEAVEEGLRWSVESNKFRRSARKVILVFGDAPPHAEDLPLCLAIAGEFSRKRGAIVSTVSCRQSRPIPALVEIAEAGRGEAFLTSDEKQIVTQLMVLAFGSKHRTKVIEAFDLLSK